MPPAATYDFIVVAGCDAGYVVANRLVQGGKHVALVEVDGEEIAGPSSRSTLSLAADFDRWAAAVSDSRWSWESMRQYERVAGPVTDRDLALETALKDMGLEFELNASPARSSRSLDGVALYSSAPIRRVLFRDRTAHGIELDDGRILNARNEVVLAIDAESTPQLLRKSSIATTADLKVSCGSTSRGHISTTLAFERSGGDTSADLADCLTFGPQIHPTYTVAASLSQQKQASIQWTIKQTLTHYLVTITVPTLDHTHSTLADREAVSLSALQAKHLLTQTDFARRHVKEQFDTPPTHTDIAFCNAAGTAAMGTCVDTELRLHGTQGLRIIDSSVIPVPVSSCNAAVTSTLAERAADLILNSNAPDLCPSRIDEEKSWDTPFTSRSLISQPLTARAQQPSPRLYPRIPSFEDLLFDLLFASVLNVYSNSMSFDHASQISAFAGFFAILWWAWFSQTLFDVRYRRRHGRLRSVAQGILRVVLLCIWLAFTTTPSEFARAGFANVTLLYALTRICLILDYALILMLEPTLRSDWRVQRGAAIITVSCVISSILWGCSRLYDNGERVAWQQGVIWSLAMVTEVVLQSATELRLYFGPLGETMLTERMATFGLIILGEGFSSLGDVLNSFSVGARNWETDGAQSGGWSGTSVMQVIASLVTLLMQFYAYFFDAARELALPPLTNLLWSYMHLLLHLASLVTVVGLKQVVAFLNAYRATERLLDYPGPRLPPQEPWSSLTSSGIAAILAEAEDLLNGVNATTADTVRSMFSIIQNTRGSQIPDVDQAQALQRAAQQMKGVKFDPPLQVVLDRWFTVANAINTQSDVTYFDWIEQNLLQTKFLYGACAVFLTADAAVKYLRGGGPSRSRRLGWIFRLVFALLLTAIQAVFIAYDGPPSPQALVGALPILAAVLFTEFVTSLVIRQYCRRRDEQVVT